MILNAISDECPHQLCDGKGQIFLKNVNPTDEDPKDYYGHPIKEIMRTCKCKDGRIATKALKDAKIPSEYTSITLRSFQTDIYGSEQDNQKAQIAKRIAVNYVKDFPSFFLMGKGLYIYSDTKGSGKTRLSASIANAILRTYKDRCYKVFYIRAIDLIENIKATFDNKELSTKALLDEVKKVDILIIDDFGAGTPTNWTEEQFTNILDYRYSNKCVTIFNSNVDVNQLDNVFQGGRLQSRIKKMTVNVVMPEVNIRTKEAEAEEHELLKKLMG